MHSAPRAVALALAVASAAGFPARSIAGDAHAVRGLHPDVATLINDARQRSPTMQALLDALDRTDLVVYVEYRPYEASAARTTWVGAFGGHRYLLVSICPRAILTERIALLGHELQHAIEIARAPQVNTRDLLRRFYRANGWADSGSDHFETAAARHTEEVVRREAQMSPGG